MSQARRILRLLQQLQKEEICTKALSFSYFDDDNPPKNNESALRMAQHDIKLVREFFGNSVVQTRRGCYRLLGDDAMRNYFIQHKETKSFRQFFAFLALFEEEILEILGGDDLEYIQKLKQENRMLYSIHGEPIEKLTSEWLEQLKKAVRDKRYISMTVNGEVLEKVQPYRIVFAQGNWYLASLLSKSKNSSGFDFVRINNIKKVELLRGTFHPDREVEYFIQNFQTLFEEYQGNSYSVEVLVAPNISRFFRTKKHLKSQKKLNDDENGLLLEYTISDEMELLPLIKRWLPDIEILSPPKLRERLYADVEKFYLKGKNSHH